MRGQDSQKCAEDLHIHVNTLRYRLQRIEQMTGRDLGNLDTRVDFFLALSLTATSAQSPSAAPKPGESPHRTVPPEGG